MSILGPGCGWLSPAGQELINEANANVAARNIITTLNNYLNITNAEVANLNATFQELLSYYSARAEAIVPYFLNFTTFNNTVADVIEIASGLVPSLEGLQLSFAQQQYQDWNATASGWDVTFGSGGSWAGTSAGFGFVLPSNPSVGLLAVNHNNFKMSQPFEYWTQGTPFNGAGAGNKTFFNMMSGGTIMVANVHNLTAVTFANFTVFDLSQGTQFYVPFVSYYNWTHGIYPIESTVQHISPFDLLLLRCNSGCGGYPLAMVEASGAYAFQNIASTVSGYNYVDSSIPTLSVLGTYGGSYGFWLGVPQPNVGVCITLAPTSADTCFTSVAQTEGNSTALGSGPGSVVAGNRTLTSFALTAQSLVNNTMLMAYDYWLTLRAITNNGEYTIPANCAIPTPSDAFPAATNYLTYALSAYNVEAVYLAYLNAIAREYGEVFTNSVGFCNNQNLGFSFNWTGSWKLNLNITASVYVAGPNGPLNLNGTNATGTTYSNVASWPAYNIDPMLLYPSEYQMNIPLYRIYPIPINNPIVGVLVNYNKNLFYGNSFFMPSWGVPTYVSLVGNGNYSLVSGNLSNVPSGGNVSQADAIEINSCYLNGIPQNPCDIAVTYFSNFTIGPVHAILPPAPIPPGGYGGLAAGLGSTCGFNALNQWYDGWAGWIGAAVAQGVSYLGQGAAVIPIIGGGIQAIINGIGCVLAWIVVILIFVLFAYVAVKTVASVAGSVAGSYRRSRSS